MREFESAKSAEELQPDQSTQERQRPTDGDEHGRSLSIEELAQRVGVSARTVRFYIAEGLLTGPGSRGKAAAYGDEHLLRLRLIRRLTDRRVPLSDVRDLLARLSTEEARELLAQEDQQTTELRQAARSPSPQEYVARLLGQARAAQQSPPQPGVPPLAAYAPASPATGRLRESRKPASTPAQQAAAWHRYELAPGLELHVSVAAADRYRDLIERLLRIAGAPESPPGS